MFHYNTIINTLNLNNLFSAACEIISWQAGFLVINLRRKQWFLNNIFNISDYIKLSDTQNYKVYSMEYPPKNIFVNRFYRKQNSFLTVFLKTIQFQVIEYENRDWINDIKF